jgi:hypothetical protein
VSLFDDYPDQRTCPHPKAEPARNITCSGASQVFMRCVNCGANIHDAGKWLPHDRIYGKVDDLLVVNDYREHVPPCQKCGAFGAELHHWAPREHFDDADDWPTGWLCVRCHNLWHLTMVRRQLDPRTRDRP